MTILYGFKLDDQGRMMNRLFDLEKMPPDWYDSPSKVPMPDLDPVQETTAVETTDHREPYVYKTLPVEGSIEFPPVADSMKRRGRPKGSKNKVTHV
jgi:hypothetical protein